MGIDAPYTARYGIIFPSTVRRKIVKTAKNFRKICKPLYIRQLICKLKVRYSSVPYAPLTFLPGLVETGRDSLLPLAPVGGIYNPLKGVYITPLGRRDLLTANRGGN